MRSPLSPSALRDLLVHPTRFFADTASLSKRPEILFVTWLAGAASVVDRVDAKLLRADIGDGAAGDAATILARSWPGFWAFVLIAGIPSAALLWMIAGWWYRKRLEWSGASNPSKELARCVWAYQNLVIAVATIVIVVIYTLVYASYLEGFHAEEWYSSIALVAVVWSCIISYLGSRTVFHLSGARPVLWFIVLPLLFYVIVFGALATVFAQA